MLIHDVIIIDDHPVVGVALKGIFENHPSVGRVTVFESAAEAIVHIEKCERRCVVILDFDMPEVNGLDVMRMLPPSGKKLVSVLVYTGFQETEVEVASIRAGAKGFISKNQGTDVLLRAFECIIGQRSYFSEPALRLALSEFNSPLQAKLTRLGPREYVIAKKLAAGESNAVIAETLFISPKTVSAHKAHIFEKLEIDNIAQLIHLLSSAAGPSLYKVES